jgi:hypothetical protein
MRERALAVVVTKVATRVFVVRGGVRKRARRTQERKGEQVVKRVETGLIPCPFISCVKANTKSGVGIDRWSLYILTTSDRTIGERAVATGVDTPEVAKCWLRDRDCDGDGEIVLHVRGRGRAMSQ